MTLKIDVYKEASGDCMNISRILHGRAEIRSFSASVEKYFTSEDSERVKYFQHE